MWVARDKDGCVCAYEKKPWRQTSEKMWIDGDINFFIDYKEEGFGYLFQLSVDAFPWLTWDDEPVEIIDAKP